MKGTPSTTRSGGRCARYAGGIDAKDAVAASAATAAIAECFIAHLSADLHGHEELPVFALDEESGIPAGLRDLALQVVRRLHRVAVDREHDVAGLHARAFRRPAHFLHDHTRLRLDLALLFG